MGDNEGQCETMWGKKRVKRLSLARHEEVPCGFGLRTGNLRTPAQHRLQEGSRISELQTSVSFFFWKAVLPDNML